MPDIVRQSYTAKVDDVSQAKRTVVSVITTDTVDRAGEVVLPSGIDLKEYKRNPVVLWSHNLSLDMDLPTIGKCLWIKRTEDGRGLIAKTQFTDDEFALKVFKLYQDEYLRAFSIGFTSSRDDGGPPTTEEIRARKDWAKARWIYRKSALHEYSACNVPCNPDALAVAVSKGLISKQDEAYFPDIDELIDQADSLGDEPPADEPETAIELPPLVGRRFGDVFAEQLALQHAQLKAAQEKAVRDSIDLARGRI